MKPWSAPFGGTLFPAFLALGLLGPCQVLRSASLPNPASIRSRVLDDLFVLRDYRAGKNSFVESPERHVGTWTNQGFRYTLADLKGQGSLRHIWTTRGDGPPYFDWEFYVDGETTPSIRGTDVDLVEAASRYPVPVTSCKGCLQEPRRRSRSKLSCHSMCSW